MSRYRADHVMQDDGLECRLSVESVHLDFHTKGRERCDPRAMRTHLGVIPSRATTADDVRRAWELGHGEVLTLRHGVYWDTLLTDHNAGRFIALDVWYGYHHTVGIAPDVNVKGWWLTSDPLLGDWVYVNPVALKLAAWQYGRHVLRMPYEALGSTETPVSLPSGATVHPGRLESVADENFGPIYYTTSGVSK